MGALGVGADDDVRDIFNKADTAAEVLAPNTRRLWKWIMVAQAAAVLAPGTWLLLLRLNWPTSLAALIVTLSTLAIVVASWWMRWRGMQMDWTRSRVLAEICRSLIATSFATPRATLEALDVAPNLKALAQQLAPRLQQPKWPGTEAARENYTRNRISDQIRYYREKQADAEATRQRLNRVVTVSLDTALFLAIAGVVIALRPESANWLRWSGSDYILGILGMFLPLVALTSQLLGAYQELNRRVGRYAQILQFLEPMESEARRINSKDALETLEGRVERCLLGELIDWYYQAEHAQVYYRSNKPKPRRALFRLKPAGYKGGLRKLATSGFGAGLNFVFKVLVGRVLVVGISVVFTTAWIAFQQKPDSLELASVLRHEDGRLLSEPGQKGTAKAWQPALAGTENGFILIAHGLHDGVTAEPLKNNQIHWMTRMQTALRSRLADRPPEIVLVDWEQAASPYAAPSTDAERTLTRVLGDVRMPDSASRFLLDISTIRPQAEAIGELVGYKLARAIRHGHLDSEAPMHLIGHSAGGFVVLHAALVLIDLGLDPARFQVTLLDTPMPKRRDLGTVARRHRLDFYQTSNLALGAPAQSEWEHYQYSDPALPPGTDSFMEAHSYAYHWYIETIFHGGNKGFNHSIILGDAVEDIAERPPEQAPAR
mgnify:CR=1 FL=1